MTRQRTLDCPKLHCGYTAEGSAASCISQVQKHASRKDHATVKVALIGKCYHPGQCVRCRALGKTCGEHGITDAGHQDCRGWLS